MSELGTVGTTYSEDYDDFQETEQYLISPQIKYSDDDLRASLTYSISKDDLLVQRDVSDKTQSLTDEQSVDLIIENQLTDNFLLTISTGYSKTEFEEDGLLLGHHYLGMKEIVGSRKVDPLDFMLN